MNRRSFGVMLGAGGLPRRRPDQQYRPNPGATAPGSRSGIVRARLVIVSGTGSSAGLFVYIGKPGPGNEPILAITSASADPFGNPVVSPFDVSPPGGSHVHIEQDGTFLVYQSPGGAGNLINSISAHATTDSYGNAVLAGDASYTTVAPFVAISRYQSVVTFYTATSQAGPWTRTLAEGLFEPAITSMGLLAVDPGGLVLGNGPKEFWIPPSGDNTGATDAANLNTVLALGGSTVHLLPGTYYVNRPLIVPAGSRLQGSAGNALSLAPTYGSVITCAAGWAQGGASDPAVILFNTGTEEQQVNDLTIDCSASAAASYGIAGYSGNVKIRDVAVNFAAVNGVAHLGPVGSTTDTWRMERVTAHRSGHSGFVVNAPDSTYIDCEAIGSGNASLAGNTDPGWLIRASNNSKFIGCRSENTFGTGDGFDYIGPSAGGTATGLSFTACSSSSSGGHGLHIDGSAGGIMPMSFTDCRFVNDGWNPFSTGTGGGNFAGISITGLNSPVVFSGCSVVPDAANGGNGPQNAVALSAAHAGGIQRIMFTNCLLWGATSWLVTDGTTTFRIRPDCTLASGPLTGPTFRPLSNTATLAGGTATVAAPQVTATSRIWLTTQAPGGAPGWLQVSARTPGTSFTILSSSATDTSTVAWEMEVT